MRAYLPGYHMVAASSLRTALARLADDPALKPFAGGTDLMVLMEAGHLPAGKFLNIWPLQELRGITVDSHSITLGALTTYTQIRQHPIVHQEFPMLVQAAQVTGAVAIQNRGTLGGNIANSSPAADTPPALLAYDAEIELVGRAGSRWLDYASFHQAYKKMDLRPGELLARVRIPRLSAQDENCAQHYQKVGTRKAQAISKLCLASRLHIKDGVVKLARVAWGSVAPIPKRSTHVEAALQQQRLSRDTIDMACAALSRDISPIDDVRSTCTYRAKVAQNLLCSVLEQHL